jgi:AcrR family transcriptional regulator
VSGSKKSNARQRIMEVATFLFAEKGFSAATVDEIAEKAGVNKALIYYYFKNKDDLLTKIFDIFMEEGLVRFQELFAKMESKEVFDSRERLSEMMKILFDFMTEKKEILKLMLMESIKGERDLFLEIMRREAGKELAGLLDEARGKGITLDEDVTQLWVTEFFTGSVPMMVYVIYRDRWARFFNINTEVLDEMFIKSFDETHIEHHRK